MTKHKRFWNWIEEEDEPRVLSLYGTIAEESWFEDEVTPDVFRKELNQGKGDIILWINSPGGDVIAAAQIYNMLIDYPGKVTVKIDGIAASAASVIAMAGDEVWMSPVSMLMIHNPMTVAIGDSKEMDKAKDMLTAVKDSILNAYEVKTGLDRSYLSKLMDGETWMDIGQAKQLGFCDGVLERCTVNNYDETVPKLLFSRRAVTNSLLSKVKDSQRMEASRLDRRLDQLKKQWEE